MEAGPIIPIISAILFVILRENTQKRQLIIIGKNTATMLIITNTPRPVLRRFILPCIVLYASERAEPTIGINEDNVKRTALVETVSAAVVIRVLNVRSPEKTVIINAIIHLISLESCDITPLKFISEDTDEVTETPKKTLNSGAIKLAESQIMPSLAITTRE